MIELRPKWCVSQETLSELLELAPWKDEAGAVISKRTGDDWTVGQGIRLSRTAKVLDPENILSRLGLRPGAAVGLAVRWSCRATAMAGTHDGGPAPMPVQDSMCLTLDLPPVLAGSLEVETCLIVIRQTSFHEEGSCPVGAVLWSDAWETPAHERAVLLEGDETRIPILSVSFKERFRGDERALWSVEVQEPVDLEDLLANVVTVYLNEDMLKKHFASEEGLPDPMRLPTMAQTAISVELIRQLTASVAAELEVLESPGSWGRGTVGEVLCKNLGIAFGSVEVAFDVFKNDGASFSRRLWSHCAARSVGEVQ
jgi:hypothetical protein